MSSEPKNNQLDAPNSVEPQGISDREKRLLAYEVAEEAKRQVSAWAKWIFGVLVAVGATLGIKTYIDLNSMIHKATEEQIARTQAETEAALATFRVQADQALHNLQLEVERTLGSVYEVGEQAKLSILSTSVAEQPITRTVARKSLQRPVGAGLSISTLTTTAATSCCIVRQDNTHFLCWH